jgi:hypothetical protein
MMHQPHMHEIPVQVESFIGWWAGGRGSKPGGDYAVSAPALLLLKDLSSSSVKQISCLACQLECLGLTSELFVQHI